MASEINEILPKHSAHVAELERQRDRAIERMTAAEAKLAAVREVLSQFGQMTLQKQFDADPMNLYLKIKAALEATA